MAERWPQRAIVFLLLVMSISTLVASSHVQPGPLLYTRSRMHKQMARSLDTRAATGTRNITRRAVQKPPMTTTTESQFYHSHVQFAADAYCLGLQKGDKVGIDGTVLWETGNGNNVQMVYVAYSPSLGIVVGHQGTNTSSYASIANDLNFDLVDPFPELQWLGSGVMMSQGFQQAWNDTAEQVLTQVKQARLMYPKARLVTTGHSLGASTALLSALHLHHALDTAIDNVVFGLPRTGNAEFADAVDKNIPTSRHITHYRDPVPHAPSQHFGYRHSSGEVWIANEDGTTVYDCVGQEDSQCADSVSIFQYEVDDHSGPYFGVTMDCRVVVTT